MQNYKRILVGVDFKEATGDIPEPTQEAIRKGLWLASNNGAELTLLSVLPGAADSTEDVLESDTEQQLQSVISSRINEIVDADDHSVDSLSVKFVHGRDWYELIREVLRSNIDLVIAGTRDQSTTKRMIYGSTGMKLLRKCPCSVWITRPDTDPESLSVIVAADDLSEVGDKVLHDSVSAAQLMHAGLVVVHAAGYPLEGAMMRTECAQEDLDNYRDKIRKDAESEILDRLSMTDYRTIQAGTQLVVQGGPADSVIDEVVKEHNADLLVMGTIGRSGIPGYLIGNTAERLLPELTCSILAIKPDEFSTPVKL